MGRGSEASGHFVNRVRTPPRTVGPRHAVVGDTEGWLVFQRGHDCPLRDEFEGSKRPLGGHRESSGLRRLRDQDKSHDLLESQPGTLAIEIFRF